MAISPGMIKILGSIASTAMSSKGKEESKPEPKLNSNFLIDADKQASQAPLNNTNLLNPKTIDYLQNVGQLSTTKRGQKLFKRVSNRNKKRGERIDNREARRKLRFESRDANQGKTYQEKRGTDVGNFFRRFSDPSVSQTPPATTSTNNNQTNYEEEKTESNNKLNTNYKIGLMDPNWKNKQFGGYGNLDHTNVALAKLKKNK